MMGKKYKLVGRTRMVPPAWSSGKRTFWRIQALQDIPEHNVKIGDLGGYVSSKNILSQFGSSWVAYDASVYKNVVVEGHAYIGGKVHIMCDFNDSLITIQGKAQILDNAQIAVSRNSNGDGYCTMVIKDRVIVSGNADLDTVKEVSGDAKISDKAKLYRGVIVTDNSVIYGNALIAEGATILGDSVVCDEAAIHTGATISNTKVSGSAQVGEDATFTGQTFASEGIFVNDVKSAKRITVPDEVDGVATMDKEYPQEQDQKGDEQVSARMQYFNEMKAKIEAYELDIVKIIKYPLMTDKTNVYTRDMAFSLSRAERLKSSDNHDFEDAIADLEMKFFSAESNAIKVASSQLTASELKKVSTAKDMLSIAGNDAASDNERKIAFAKGFKQLEGVLTVPENAVDAFRIKIGMKEIGA